MVPIKVMTFLHVWETMDMQCIKVRNNAQVRLKKWTHSKKSISYISEKGFAKVEG